MCAEHVIARDIVTWMSAMGMWPMDGAQRDEVQKSVGIMPWGGLGKKYSRSAISIESSYSASSCAAVSRGNMILEIHQKNLMRVDGKFRNIRP